MGGGRRAKTLGYVKMKRERDKKTGDSLKDEVTRKCIKKTKEKVREDKGNVQRDLGSFYI